MHILPPLAAFLALGATVIAQATCNAGAAPLTTLATMNPFAGGSLYGHPNYPNSPGPNYPGFSFLFDLQIAVPVDFSRIDLDLYDAGGLVNLGNGTTVTSPNQVGATTTVTFMIWPGASWIGNELSPTGWGTLGTGTLTVNQPHTDSPIVFNPPINLPAGTWGVAIQVPPTTNGPNPGPLHPMVDNTSPQPLSYVTGAFTMTNVQFQRESWAATLAPAVHKQSLEFHFTPLSGYANWTTFGAGCGQPGAPVLGLAARPLIGTTIDFRTTNIQPNSLFNFWLFGFQPDPNGLGLAPYGLPGCSLYLQFGSPIVTNLSAVASGLATIQLPVPNDPTYVGVVLYGQAAPMMTGPGPGFHTSNAVCVALGLL